jgi:RNA polymerase sigma-70 factor (ECF subfamily)
MVKQNEPIDFAELVSAAQLGDSKSIDRLVKEVEPRLRGYIYGKTLDRQSIDDVVQESLLRMIKFLGDLKKAECFWSWLFQVAQNATSDYLRRHQQKDVRLFSTLGDGRLAESLQCDYDKFGDASVRRELRAVVRESISRLQTRMRDVVYMRCFCNMSYRQISDVAGLSENAARSAFVRAKGKIKRDLKNRMSISHGRGLSAGIPARSL